MPADGRLFPKKHMKPETKQALEAARHELVTLDGLLAADGCAPHETWTIDTSAVVALIDAALAAGDTHSCA
jgi:hypothetical protein